MQKKLMLVILTLLFCSYQTEAQVSWNTNGNNIASGDFIGTLNGYPLSFKTTPTSSGSPLERMCISENGDVGIGTSMPSGLWPAGRIFHVQGVDPALRIADNSGASASWQLSNSASAFYANIPFRFTIDSGSYFSVAKNTNVTGVYNPANFYQLLKLNDQGILYVRGIKVRADNFPDYVFEKNYELMSLDSLQAFIHREKHLPDIPSALSVEKDGLDLGENQELLLRKIEELTLYVLSLKEELKQLKKSINSN